MKEIKAFIHKHRVAAVIEALASNGYLTADNPHRCRNINIAATQSLLRAVVAREQRYSVELSQAIINESKLELLCEDAQVDTLVALIVDSARTGQVEVGWVYVSTVAQAVQISSPSA